MVGCGNQSASALEEHHLANKVTRLSTTVEARLSTGGNENPRARNPVVVLLDNKMPKVGGLEVLKTIKADEHLR